MQPVTTSNPLRIVRIDTKEKMRRIMVRWHMHEGRVLPTLLLAVVHLANGLLLFIPLMIIQGGGDAGRDRKLLGIFEGQPQSPLPSHADAKKTDATGAKLPALLHQ